MQKTDTAYLSTSTSMRRRVCICMCRQRVLRAVAVVPVAAWVHVDSQRKFNSSSNARSTTLHGHSDTRAFPTKGPQKRRNSSSWKLKPLTLKPKFNHELLASGVHQISIKIYKTTRGIEYRGFIIRIRFHLRAL